MYRRNAGTLQALLEPKIEVRRIDPDEQIRWVGQYATSQLLADLDDLTQVAQHLDVSAHCELVHRIAGFEAKSLHPWPTDAAEAQSWPALLERGDKMRAEQVARGFTGDHGDARSFRFHGLAHDAARGVRQEIQHRSNFMTRFGQPPEFLTRLLETQSGAV